MKVICASEPTLDWNNSLRDQQYGNSTFLVPPRHIPVESLYCFSSAGGWKLQALLTYRGKKVKFKLAPQACITFTTISKAHLILWPFFLEMRCCIPRAPAFSQDGPHMVHWDLTLLLHCPIFLGKKSLDSCSVKSCCFTFYCSSLNLPLFKLFSE